METLTHVLVLLHLLGWAALFGATLVQVREPVKRVNAVMRDGVGTAFVVGLLLVGVLEAGEGSPDHVKIAVKFTIGLVLLVLVMANLRKERIPAGVYFGILGLTIANVAVAVLWR